LADHELVGEVDHLAEVVVVDRTFEVDGVPVILVLLVAGADPREPGPLGRPST